MTGKKESGWRGESERHAEAARKGGKGGGGKSQKKYYHIVIVDKGKFRPKSFRTLDVGDAGGLQFVNGQLRASGKWATQKVLVSKRDFTLRDGTLVPTTERGRRERDDLARQGVTPLSQKKYKIHG